MDTPQEILVLTHSRSVFFSSPKLFFPFYVSFQLIKSLFSEAPKLWNLIMILNSSIHLMSHIQSPHSVNSIFWISLESVFYFSFPQLHLLFTGSSPLFLVCSDGLLTNYLTLMAGSQISWFAIDLWNCYTCVSKTQIKPYSTHFKSSNYRIKYTSGLDEQGFQQQYVL